MISKFLEIFYTKIFINIIVENSQTVVYVEVCSGDEVKDTVHKTFETVGMNMKMYEFINSYTKETPFFYISVLDNSPSQGAVPATVNSEINKYVDIGSARYISLHDWSVYTAGSDINAIKHEYRSIGVDFIFSPFLILAKFFEEKINSTLAMFILVEDNYIAMSVFDNSKLLYAQYLNMEHQEESDLLIDTPLEDDLSLDLDSIDLDTDIDIDMNTDTNILEEFADIEDLDMSGDIDEFSEAEDIQEIIIHEKKKHSINANGFNEDYKRFLLIQKALGIFYKDKKYKSQFIESVYIADGVGVSNDLKGYLEEEIYLNVYIRKIDLGTAVCDMAKAEIR